MKYYAYNKPRIDLFCCSDEKQFGFQLYSGGLFFWSYGTIGYVGLSKCIIGADQVAVEQLNCTNCGNTLVDINELKMLEVICRVDPYFVYDYVVF